MIVLDACALCEMVRRTPEGLALQALMLPNEKAISCDLAYAEVASVFRKLARRESLDAAQAARYVQMAMELVDEFHPLGPLQTEALRESIRLDHSAYDLFYFVLARRLGATLFTTDRKLMALCHRHGVDCLTTLDLQPIAS